MKRQKTFLSRAVFVVLSFLFVLLVEPICAQGGLLQKPILERLNLSGGLPQELLSTKAVVLHTHTFSDKELQTVQQFFQKTGIDAVAFYPLDVASAGADVSRAFSAQLIKREISNLVILEKANAFRIAITAFNGKETLVDDQQPAWSITNNALQEALKILQREALSNLKKKNLLISETPEPGPSLSIITGRRNEFYAVDMKVDLVAVPKFGDEELDKELERIMTENFPFKFKLTEPGTPEKELRKQGMFYVLCFVNARAKVAKELLGYSPAKSESAIVSVTFPDGVAQLKNIPAHTHVFKAYFKHIDSGNVFLGTKWDADVTWQTALLNNILGMKAELRLN